MRLLKAFLVGLTGLFIVITLFSLLIPSRVRVSRAVLINNTSQQEVFQQIGRFNNWPAWHPVFTVDSATMKLQPAGTDGLPSGCIITQRGKEIIINLLAADTSSVKFSMQAEGENEIDNDIVISSQPGSSVVQVEWRAITKLRWYPWQKFYGIFIDQLTGPGYEVALNGLKDHLE